MEKSSGQSLNQRTTTSIESARAALPPGRPSSRQKTHLLSIRTDSKVNVPERTAAHALRDAVFLENERI